MIKGHQSYLKHLIAVIFDTKLPKNAAIIINCMIGQGENNYRVDNCLYKIALKLQLIVW